MTRKNNQNCIKILKNEAKNNKNERFFGKNALFLKYFQEKLVGLRNFLYLCRLNCEKTDF